MEATQKDSVANEFKIIKVINARVTQSGRAPLFQSGGRGFEARLSLVNN